MRRFISFLLATITIFLGIGVSFKPVATSIKPDLSYSDGKEITFKLKDRSGAAEIKDEKAATDYAAIMETRLNNFGINEYEISTVQNESEHDTITVRVTLNNDDKYEELSNLLKVNPNIELATTKEECIVSDDDGSFDWHSTTAYVESSGTSTVLVKPIPDGAKTKIEELIAKAKEEEGGDDPKSLVRKSATDKEGEDEKKPSIVMWLNRSETDQYANKDTDKNVAAKIFHEFRSDEFYYDSNNNAIKIIFTPSTETPDEINNAYNKAYFNMNVLNATETKYDCDVIYTRTIEASVENLLSFGSHVNVRFSASFLALIIAFVIICLILSVFYNLGAVPVITSATLNTYLAFVIFTLFRLTFNIGAYVGIIAVFLLSLVTGVFYNHFLHDELHKGRSLKKSNFEASKKTTIIALDISVIMFVFGIFLFFIGGIGTHSIGAILIIAAVFNIIINTLVLKGLMWLLTNNTSFQKKFNLFNVKNKDVPDLAKAEKPTYQNPFEKKNFFKHNKIVALVFGGLIIASLTGIITFSAMNKNSYNTSNYFDATNEIRFEINLSASASKPAPYDSPESFKESLALIKNNETNKQLAFDDVQNYEYKYYNSIDKTEYIKYYFVVPINEKKCGDNDVIYTYSNYEEKFSLKDALIEMFDNCGYVCDNDPYIVNSTLYTLPDSTLLILVGTVVSCAVSCAYFLIRFKPSRVLSTFAMTLSSVIVGSGLVILFRFVATPIMAIGSVLPALFTLIACYIICIYDKEFIKDERLRNLDTRKIVLNKALKASILPISLIFFVSLFISINFAGFGPAMYASLYLQGVFGILASVYFVVALFNPINNYLDKSFSNIRIPEIKHKKKYSNNNKTKNEHTEAIFPGIND